MKIIRDFGLLLIYCFLTLFYVSPDFFYVLAFLAALIFCCADSFLDINLLMIPITLLYLAAAWISPSFLCFFPAVTYVLFRHRRFGLLIAGVCCCVYFFCNKALDLFPFTLNIFGILLSYLLQTNTVSYEQLDALYRHTRDDSTELNLLLAEKNHSLLEKQDYEIYTATLRERNRIAREIHDNVGHLLTRSILLVGAMKTVNSSPSLAEPLETLDSTLNLAMDSIRKSVHDLHDEAINLEEAIHSLLKDFTFCQATFQYDMGRDIPKEIKYSFISITKEALANVMKHSNATHVYIIMREHPALYQLCVEDNGTLYSPADTGIGLSNIKERISTLKGNLQMQHAGKGFKIFITIPKEI